MANGELIFAQIKAIESTHFGAGFLTLQVQYSMAVQISPFPQFGLLQIFDMDSTLTGNQISNNVRERVALYISDLTGLVYAANEVEGCAI